MMKKRASRMAALAGFGVLALTEAASAYYSPRLGRFLSRDPIREPGAVVVRQSATGHRFIPRGSATAQDAVESPVYAYRDSARDVVGPNIYTYVYNRPTVLLDPLGLDVTNNSNLPAWVYISGTGWVVVNPGATIKGDTDFICPNASKTVKAPDGTYRCLKIIDCFDATITGPDASGQYAIFPTYAGMFALRGNTFWRKCVCASPVLALRAQRSYGGAKDPVKEGIGKPPDYP